MNHATQFTILFHLLRQDSAFLAVLLLFLLQRVERRSNGGASKMNPTMSFQDWCIQNHAYLLLHFYQEGKNPLPPDKIGFSVAKRVRFRCHVCGLSWQRTLNSIANHPLVQTCPFCEHRRPSPFYNLATEYPELLAEWDNEKNALLPENCLPHSQQSVYWRCEKNHR